MMQKHFNQHTKGKSKGGYGHRCHSSLSYEKEKNSPQYQSYYTDETFSFSEEFARIVQKFCPKIELKFSSESLEGILNTIELAFEDILEDMKETLGQEFTQKEDFLQKTTLNLIKYEELLSSREKDFNNQVAAWNAQRESDHNRIQLEKEEIIKLKCRLEKELEIQEEMIQENEKKTFKIIEDYEEKQCELIREKLENQNLKWDLEQMSLKLEEKEALISWREKTMIEDMKKITEEKSKIENERIANNILNFELINAAPRTSIQKRSYSSIEKTDLSADPPSFALNDSRFNNISIQKYEGFNINSKTKSNSFSSIKKNPFPAFTKSQQESEIEDRDSVLRQLEEKELKDREINEEMMRQERTRERLKMERFEKEKLEFELMDLERRENELIENAKREHEHKESERKEAERRENEKLILELKELERLDAKRREEERQEHQRIEDDFKEELMKKIMIKESELEEKQLEIELLEKMVLEEKSSLLNERENLHKEKQELQSEKLAFYEEIMEERRKIENYLTDIASKTDILNSRREKLLKAQQIIEEKEIMIELEKRVGKSPEKIL